MNTSYADLAVLSPDKNYLAVVKYQTLKIENMRSHRLRCMYIESIVLHVTFSPCAKFLATIHTSGNVFLWDLTAYDLPQKLPTTGRVIVMAFSPCGQYLAVGASQNIFLWNMRNQVMKNIEKHGPMTSNISWAPDSSCFGVALHGNLIIWNRSLEKIQEISLDIPIHSCAWFRPDVLVLGGGGDVGIWCSGSFRAISEVDGCICKIVPGTDHILVRTTADKVFMFYVTPDLELMLVDTLRGNLTQDRVVELNRDSVKIIEPPLLNLNTILCSAASRKTFLSDPRIWGIVRHYLGRREGRKKMFL